MANHIEILDKAYKDALEHNRDNEFDIIITDPVKKELHVIVERSENNKGILAVITTLLAHKILDPNQDIRYHQAQLENGFAGRSIDTQYITPWIRKHDFPSMAESGWLTRSLEQVQPYDLNYPGSIKPKELKTAFLDVIDNVQTKNMNAEIVLAYLLQLLIAKRDAMNIDLAKPHGLSIANIIILLQKHFTYNYSGSGAARLPTLAIYASYQCMMKELSRYEDKTLLELESHTSADVRSGRIGDIDIWNKDESDAFEGVEIKHEIKITPELVKLAYEKFKIYPTMRYYLLTTADMSDVDFTDINKEIDRIAKTHGCQVIVNGVYSTLKYYLRLIKDPAEFVDNYVELMKRDKAIKFIHKKVWNDLVSGNLDDIRMDE